jgi:hypothetical protein
MSTSPLTNLLQTDAWSQANAHTFISPFPSSYGITHRTYPSNPSTLAFPSLRHQQQQKIGISNLWRWPLPTLLLWLHHQHLLAFLCLRIHSRQDSSGEFLECSVLDNSHSMSTSDPKVLLPPPHIQRYQTTCCCQLFCNTFRLIW